MTDSSGVEELYKNFGILADAGKDIGKHSEAYEGILKGAKGSTGEKKLAAGFITRFFRHFPDLAETAMDTMLDLIEDEDAQTRRSAIKYLPDISKGATDTALCTRVADVLTQLLPTEDATDLAMVKTAMATVLQSDTQSALVGIFGQITGEDETVREKAIEYVSTSLMSMRHKLFLTNPDNEKHLLTLIKKALDDVSGEEFETFMEVLSKLQYTGTLEGAQEIGAIIAEQAELSAKFQAQDSEVLDRFTTCFRQVLKFCKQGPASAPFIKYICQEILPHFTSIAEEQSRHEVLQLLAEGCLCEIEVTCAQECIEPIFKFLLEYMPLPPPSEEEPPKLQFSIVECLLFTFHQLGQKVPEFLTGDENVERLKDFRLRLQYFARGCQTYHAQLQAAMKGKTVIEQKDDQSKLRSIALKTTANVNAIIKDFFHNPPSYKTMVILSWGPKRPESHRDARKRPSTEGASAAKRKPSPIRFTEGASSRREARTLYEPPKDRFSKSVSNGDFDQYQGGGRGNFRRRGRGRGGFRGRGGGTWRV